MLISSILICILYSYTVVARRRTFNLVPHMCFFNQCFQHNFIILTSIMSTACSVIISFIGLDLHQIITSSNSGYTP